MLSALQSQCIVYIITFWHKLSRVSLLRLSEQFSAAVLLLPCHPVHTAKLPSVKRHKTSAVTNGFMLVHLLWFVNKYADWENWGDAKDSNNRNTEFHQLHVIRECATLCRHPQFIDWRGQLSHRLLKSILKPTLSATQLARPFCHMSSNNGQWLSTPAELYQ